MKNYKLLFSIIIVGFLVASINIAFAATITTSFVAPSSNFAGKGSQYAIGFNTVTTGTVAKVMLDFPAGFTVSGARVADVNGIGSGTLSVLGTSITYTVTSPQSIPAGTQVYFFLTKIQNSPTIGPKTVTITTLDGSDAIIDGPSTAPFQIQNSLGTTLFVNDANGRVGIGTSTPAQKLDVIGNIRLTGNIVSPNDICIGTCP